MDSPRLKLASSLEHSIALCRYQCAVRKADIIGTLSSLKMGFGCFDCDLYIMTEGFDLIC